MKKCFMVFLLIFSPLLLQMLHAEDGARPEHFFNAPENINPNPNYLPGPYALPETQAARTLYQQAKEQLITDAGGVTSNVLLTLPAGELTFTAIKNEKVSVLGYFRNYFGIVKLEGDQPAGMDILIDVNSLDTTIPGRNNRILDLFFESVKPEFGAIQIHFDSLDLGGKTLFGISDGQTYPLRASGSVALHGVERPVESVLRVKKEGNAWMAETAEPIIFYISDFGLAAQAAVLLKACNHQSIANKVEVRAKFYLK